MKGFKDKSGKFRPTENKNGVRKSRDQTTKTQGVRLQRATISKKLPDFRSFRKNWTLEFENGKVSRVSLGNLTDAGWYWHGEGDQFNTFMTRMTNSDVWEELVSDFKEDGIKLEMIKPSLLKNLSGELTPENDDGLYSISGDNRRWRFGEDDEVSNRLDGEADHAEESLGLEADEREEFKNEFWKHYKGGGDYNKFLKDRGNRIRNQLVKDIEASEDFDDLADAYKDANSTADEEYSEWVFGEEVSPATHDAVDAIIARRDEEGKSK